MVCNSHLYLYVFSSNRRYAVGMVESMKEPNTSNDIVGDFLSEGKKSGTDKK
jgi:hypothetical protein